MAHWADIATMIKENYLAYDAFVVLLGTDTMAYCASALSFMMENLTKTVVLTGSQVLWPPYEYLTCRYRWQTNSVMEF